MSFYDFKVIKMNGQEISMEEYKGKEMSGKDLHR